MTDGLVFGVTGGRDFPDEKFVWDSLMNYVVDRGPIVAMVNGMAKGVDQFAYNWAKYYGIPVREFPADWEGQGDNAGPLRNQQMIDDNPDMTVVLVFPGRSGTLDMMRRARKAKLQRIFYEHDYLSPEEKAVKWGWS